MPSHYLRSKTKVTNQIVKGENTFDIYRDAPLGTGFIFGQIYIDITLIVQGTIDLNPISRGIKEFNSIGTFFKNIGMQTEDKAKSNLPFFIFIMVIIVIVLIALVFLVQKIPNEAISDSYSATKKGIPTIQKGITNTQNTFKKISNKVGDIKK